MIAFPGDCNRCDHPVTCCPPGCNCDQCRHPAATCPPGCNEIPVVRHPSTASGECTGLDNHKIKAGQTADWVLPAGAFQAKNPDANWWEDEVTELFITTEAEEFIELV